MTMVAGLKLETTTLNTSATTPDSCRGGIGEVLQRGSELNALEPGSAARSRSGDIVSREVAVIDAPVIGRRTSENVYHNHRRIGSGCL